MLAHLALLVLANADNTKLATVPYEKSLAPSGGRGGEATGVATVGSARHSYENPRLDNGVMNLEWGSVPAESWDSSVIQGIYGGGG